MTETRRPCRSGPSGAIVALCTRRFLVLFILTALAVPCLAGGSICIELVYSDGTTGDAIITVRDLSGEATTATVGAGVQLSVVDSLLLVDTEMGLTFTELDETTFLASIPFTDAIAPAAGDDLLSVSCLDKIQVWYTDTQAETIDDEIVYACDGIDVIECVGPGVIDRREILLMVNGFVINGDLMLLNDFREASDKSSTLKYGATITETGWTTNLTGEVFGEPLNVTYTGYLYEESDDVVLISYSSTGLFGAEIWNGNGQFCWREDQVSGAPVIITGDLSTYDCVPAGKVEIGLEVGASVGWIDIGIGVSKDLGSGTLSGYASVGTGGGLASVSGGMHLDQASGSNQGYVEVEAFWGLWSHEEAVGDATQAYGISGSPGGHDPTPDLDAGDRPADDLPDVWLNIAPPVLPDGATPGTNHLQPGDTLYDAGYVGSYAYLSTDLFHVDPLHLAQDAYPATGFLNYADLGAADVRFDMAENIAPREHLHNDPGDSVCITAKPILSGATFTHPPRMHYKIAPNPLFDPYRSPGGQPFPEGYVEGVQVVDAGGDPVPDRWCFDLPDQDFLYPGDVMHYYFETEETDGFETLTRTLPDDLTGYADVPGYDGTDFAGVYPDRYRMRALPACGDEGFGLERPSILVVYPTAPIDYGPEYVNTLEILDEVLEALRNLGYQPGVDFDLYAENDGGAGMGNGLGGRASPDLLADYRTILYFYPDGIAHHLDDAASLDAGAYADVELLHQWWSSGGKNLLMTGNHLVTDVNTLLPSPSGLMMDIWGGPVAKGGDINLLVSGWSDRVGAVPGNSLATDVTLLIQDQVGSDMTCDGVEPGPGSETVLEYLDGDGDPIATTCAAGILNIDAGGGSRCVLLPFSFAYAATTEPAAGATNPLAGRTVLLNDVLEYFGHVGSGPPVDVPDVETLVVRTYPNPFNATGTLVCDVPDRCRLTVTVYNTRGQLVRTLIDETVGAGRRTLVWDGRDDTGRPTASEVYLYRVTAGSEVLTGKLNLVK